MEQKCKSGTTMMKLCFHIKYKERKREKARTNFLFQSLVRIWAISENVQKEKRRKRRNKGGGEKVRKEGGGRKEEASPPPFHSNIYSIWQVQSSCSSCAQLMSYHPSVANVGFLSCKRAKLIDKHCLLLTCSLRALGWLIHIWEVIPEVCESSGSKSTKHM